MYLSLCLGGIAKWSLFGVVLIKGDNWILLIYDLFNLAMLIK